MSPKEAAIVAARRAIALIEAQLVELHLADADTPLAVDRLDSATAALRNYGTALLALRGPIGHLAGDAEALEHHTDEEILELAELARELRLPAFDDGTPASAVPDNDDDLAPAA